MNEDKKKLTLGEEIWDIIKFIAIALVIVLPIRFFIAQPFIVSGSSMYPTFHDKDYLIVDEISYRFTEPKRGDVIVFKYPLDPSRYFIKRIIGLPGETLDFKNNKVYLEDANGKDTEMNEPYLSQVTLPPPNPIVHIPTGDYFVMGDNRGASSDSRAWGFLPRNLMIGRPFLRLLPLKQIAAWPGNLKSFEKK